MKKILALALVAACGGPKASPTPVTPPPADPDVPPGDVAKTPPAPPPAVGKPKTDLIPRSVLFGNPERAGVQMSPDGKWLSWLAPKDGVLNVWIAPVGKMDQAKAITSDTKRPIYRYFWSFNNKHVLYMQDTAGDENFHLFRVDIADGKSTDITPYAGARVEVAGLTHKQPNTVLVHINDRNPQAMDLYRLDLVSGKREMMAQADDGLFGFVVDHDLKVRFAQKRMPDGSAQILEGDGKTWKPWDTIPFEDAENTGIVGVTPDNKGVYVSETRGRDTGALVSIDMKTKQKKVLAEDAKADSGPMITHPTKKTVQAVGFEYDRLRWKVLDASIQKDLDALAKIDGGEAHITSRTLDDKTWIIATTSEQHPVRYYVWDRAKQKSTFLFALRPELEKQPLVKMWPVVIKSRDGLDLVSYLTLPASADPDGDGKPNTAVPMVLNVHGGPWARDTWGYNPEHQLFANRGYAVLSVNYRGSTGFGKKFLNAANLQWGKKMHDDLIDAVDWAVKTGVTPKDKVCIYGGSYGGYATLVGVTMTPDVFACGVDLVGVSNLLTFMSSIPAYWAPFISVLHQRVGNPETKDGNAALVAVSPVTHAGKIKKPLLIGQGANDPRVKQAESEQIVAAMQKHSLPVTYVLFPDEGHGFARPENNIAFYAMTEAFLSAHLGGFYLPITAEEIKASSAQIKVGKQGVPGLP